MVKRSPKTSRTNSPSDLGTNADRFLSQVVAHALDDNWRSPEDFLSQFGPRDLMEGLASNIELRAQILISAAGVHEKLARKKSTASAAEDLQLALDEGITDARQIVSQIPADDRVRFFDKPKLWTFAFGDQFWTASGAQLGRAAERMTFLLQLALDEGLITLEDIFDALGFEDIAKHLPADELRKIVAFALTAGRNKDPLTEDTLLDVVPFGALLTYIPLRRSWESIVLELLARPCGLLSSEAMAAKPIEQRPRPSTSVPMPSAKPAAHSVPAAAQAPAVAASASASSSAPTQVTATPAPAAAPPPAPAAPPPLPTAAPTPVVAPIAVASGSPATAAAGSATKNGQDANVTAQENAGASAEKAASNKPSSEDLDVDLDFEVESALKERPAHEQEARNRVLEKLRGIDRLPPRHEGLSTPMILSIESMYAELLTADDDEDREMAIRDSFPNEAHLRQALLAIIELLDPSIETKDPVMQSADVASLIKVVLFEEERRRGEGSGAAQPPSADGAAAQGQGTAPPRRPTATSGASSSNPPGKKSSLPPPPPIVKRR